MRVLLAIFAALVLLALMLPGIAQSHPVSKHTDEVKAPLLHEIRWYRSQTQRLLRLMGKRTYPVANAEINHPKWRPWIRDHWQARYEKARAQYRVWQKSAARWERLDRDIHRATAFAADLFGVSYAWLHACMHSEGGHHGWPPNWAGAGGPFQFLSGTFKGMSVPTWPELKPGSFTAARNKGAPVPLKYRNWYSDLGQALTAAYAFSRGYSYHWYGSGC